MAFIHKATVYFIKKVPSKTVDFSHQIQKEKFQN